MNIVVLGLPGSGKGTQSKLLAERLKLFYFEAGGFSRDLAKRDARIRKIVSSGKLIPEEEMTRLVFDYLEKNVPSSSGILFDGYPRFVGQFLALKNWLASRGEEIDWVIFLEVAESEIIRRLSARRFCPRCLLVYNLITNPPQDDSLCDRCKMPLMQREDDRREVVENRIQEYKNNVLPLINLIQDEKFFLKVDGEKPIDEVTREIVKKIGFSK